jgi:pantetheine-phosphate adenylyltransferase
MKIAVCPGSFDPPTSGHIDIIERAAKIFDYLIVTVAVNPAKKPLFTLKERVEMLKEATKHLKNVEIDSFEGLLIEYVRKRGAKIIVKGLRAVTDFEYEFQMALINKKLAEDVETIFLMTKAEESFLSSSIVKEVASLKGSIKGLVPENVEKELIKKFKFKKGR